MTNIEPADESDRLKLSAPPHKVIAALVDLGHEDLVLRAMERAMLLETIEENKALTAQLATEQEQKCKTGDTAEIEEAIKGLKSKIDGEVES